MIINGVHMTLEEATEVLRYGTIAAKHELMAQMFQDMDEDFVKMFQERVGIEKFYEFVALC